MSAIKNGINPLSNVFPSFFEAFASFKDMLELDGASGVTAFFTALRSSIPALKGDLMALAPTLGKIALALAAAYAGYKLIYNFTHAGEIAESKMNDAFSEYDESKSKIESINSELETTKSRINELEAKGGLTIVEQSELDKLKEQNKLLEVRKDILDHDSVAKAKTAAQATTKSFNTNYTEAFMPTSDSKIEFQRQWAEEMDGGHGWTDAQHKNNVSGQLAFIKHLEELRDATDFGSDDWTEYQNKIDNFESSIWETVSDWLEYKDKIESIPETKRTQAEEEVLKSINSSIETVYKELDPAKWGQMKLDDFFGLDSIQDEKSKLLDLAKDKKYEGISKDDFSDYFKTVASDLQEALGENYLDIIADAINSEAGVVNVDNIKKNLKKDYAQSKFIGDERGFSSWVDNLSSEDTEIVYKLSLNADSANWSLDQWIQKLQEYKESSEQFLSDLESNVSKTQSVIEKVGKANTLLGKSNNGNSVELDADQLKEYADALEYVNGAFQLNYEKVRQLNQEKVDEQIQTNVEAMQKAQAQLLINNQKISDMRSELSGLNAAQSQRREIQEESISKLKDENTQLRFSQETAFYLKTT